MIIKSYIFDANNISELIIPAIIHFKVIVSTEEELVIPLKMWRSLKRLFKGLLTIVRILIYQPIVWDLEKYGVFCCWYSPFLIQLWFCWKDETLLGWYFYDDAVWEDITKHKSIWILNFSVHNFTNLINETHFCSGVLKQ